MSDNNPKLESAAREALILLRVPDVRACFGSDIAYLVSQKLRDALGEPPEENYVYPQAVQRRTFYSPGPERRR